MLLTVPTAGRPQAPAEQGASIARAPTPIVPAPASLAPRPSPLVPIPAATPRDAVRAALRDVRTIFPMSDRRWIRYIWIPPWAADPRAWAGAVGWGVNDAVSRSEVIVRCPLVPQASSLMPHAFLAGRGGQPPFAPRSPQNGAVPEPQKVPAILVRINLRELAGDDSAQSLAELYGSLQHGEPYFHVTRVIDGKTVVEFGSHVGVEAMSELQAECVSVVPVLRADWFLKMILTTIEGGRYYDFAGVEQSDERRGTSKKTAEQKFFAKLGAKLGDLPNANRVAMFRSEVTGKPRIVDLLPSDQVRPGTAAGLATETHDPSDDDVDAAADPIRNLINFRDKAREAIGVRPNGLPIYGLFAAGNGRRQDSAPDDVVQDHEVPRPHTARLQCAIGCIRCHRKNDQLQPVVNDVASLLVPRPSPLATSLNAFGDLALADRKDLTAQVQLLAGLYGGNFEKPLARGRDDFQEASWKASGGHELADTAELLSHIYGDYRYPLVTPRQACFEIGFQTPDDKMAIALLNRLWPPLAAVVDSDGEPPVSPEDPILAALKEGKSVNRFQWEAVYGDAAFRAEATNHE
jgi:hypothetical protein